MASKIPEKLKTIDISRFALRAQQLEKFKPIIAYWCEYWIGNQIIAKGLHAADEECLKYTTDLLDKLETIKQENATNDAIHDDLAAKAYVEQFAAETFSRAEKSMNENRVTVQTADTFRAAATFLDLLQIWDNPLPQDVAAKSKFAKYHALRIAKAIKAGEDPNASNPVKEPTPAIEQPPALDASDPDVQRINGEQPPQGLSGHPSPAISAARGGPSPAATSPSAQPSDVGLPEPPKFLPEPWDRPAEPQISPPIGADQLGVSTSPGAQHHDISPLAASPTDRNNSVGGGYFPEVPTFTSEASAPSLPTAPPEVTMDDVGSIGGPPMSPTPQDFYNVQDPATPQPPVPVVPPITELRAIPPQPPQASHAYNQLQSYLPPQPPSRPPGGYNNDDEAVATAQKHAKWAISALNFEDVDTAVKELRVALQALGAL